MDEAEEADWVYDADDADDAEEAEEAGGVDDQRELERFGEIDDPREAEEEDDDREWPSGARGRREARGGRSRRGRGRGSDRAPREAPQAERSRPVGSRRMLINATDEQEIRIAVLTSGRLDLLHYERTADKKYLGNIYKGRVVNLEPAIQAAFVDIGIGRNGFLHVSDVLPVYRDATAIPIDRMSWRPENWKRLRIQDILRKGQEVLVQITKDSIGAKGPSLTTYVSVPGKYLVLMPGVSRFGVSKRIQDDDERQLLRERLRDLDPPEGMGFIVRTAGQEESDERLARDYDYLMGIWGEVVRAVREERTPCLINAESDLVIRAMRDLLGADVEEIFVDEEAVYQRARRFLQEVMPEASKRLKRYTGSAPLFSKFGVEQEIEKIYNRQVPLPSGGHLVIEQTEALVAIDVNSGKYRDEEDLEATALKTNLEAADEVARQLRLRDLGGVIIIDFIDMEVLSNRREVERAVRDALKSDRAKSWITKISRFGIVEMTRQRVRPSFEREHHVPCERCGGSGTVKSPSAAGTGILRELRGSLSSNRRSTCEVYAAPKVAEYLVNDRRRDLVDLETVYEKTIWIRADPNYRPEQYSVKFH